MRDTLKKIEDDQRQEEGDCGSNDARHPCMLHQRPENGEVEHESDGVATVFRPDMLIFGCFTRSSSEWIARSSFSCKWPLL